VEGVLRRRLDTGGRSILPWLQRRRIAAARSLSSPASSQHFRLRFTPFTELQLIHDLSTLSATLFAIPPFTNAAVPYHLLPTFLPPNVLDRPRSDPTTFLIPQPRSSLGSRTPDIPTPIAEHTRSYDPLGTRGCPVYRRPSTAIRPRNGHDIPASAALELR
jgi:hypothetical protein